MNYQTFGELLIMFKQRLNHLTTNLKKPDANLLYVLDFKTTSQSAKSPSCTIQIFAVPLQRNQLHDLPTI